MFHDPASQPRNRRTIGQLMIVIASVALALAFPRWLASGTYHRMAIGLLAVLAWLALVAWIVVSMRMVFECGILGSPCPGCRRWTLRPLARHRHFYRCSSCRLRLKRYGWGPWIDASNCDDSYRFVQKPESRRWQGFAVPKDLEATTIDTLLHNKRSRGLTGGEPTSYPILETAYDEEAKRKVRRFLTKQFEKGVTTDEGVGTVFD